MTMTMLMMIVFAFIFSGVSAQKNCNTLDSLITSALPGLNPQTEEFVNAIPVGTFGSDFIEAWAVRPNHTDTTFSVVPQSVLPGDTAHLSLVNLLPGTNYFYGARAIISLKKSSVKMFTTTTCPFSATINHKPAGCRDTLYFTSPVGGNYSYQWKIGNVNIPGAIQSTYVAVNSGVYTGVATLGACTSTSSPITVAIVPVAVTITGVNSICAGSSGTWTAGGGADSYVWFNGMSGPEVTLTLDNTQIISVTGTSNGCTGTASKTVTVNPLPVVTVTPSKLNVCKNGVNNTVNLVGKPTGTGGIFGGDYVIANVFYSGNADPGPYVVFYKNTSSTTHCSDSATAVINVDGPPLIDSVKYTSSTQTFNAFGDFTGKAIDMLNNTTGKTTTPTSQNGSGATFTKVVVNVGDLLTFHLVGDVECYADWTFKFGVGIEEITSDSHKNVDSRIFDLQGRELKSPPYNVPFIKGGKTYLIFKQ